jgi:hypothetical protein
MDAGIITAAAAPWTNRATTSAPGLGARPHATEAATNSASPTPNARRAQPIGERPGGQQQRGKHQRVAVHDPLQPGHPAAKVAADSRQGDVDDHRVERDHEKPEQRGSERRVRVSNGHGVGPVGALDYVGRVIHNRTHGYASRASEMDTSR